MSRLPPATAGAAGKNQGRERSCERGNTKPACNQIGAFENELQAKTGQGIDELISKLCDNLPPPKGLSDAPPRALIFDSLYDDYRGVIVYFRVFDGRLRTGDKIRMMGLGRTFNISEIGKYTPKATRVHAPAMKSAPAMTSTGVITAASHGAATKICSSARCASEIAFDGSTAQTPRTGRSCAAGLPCGARTAEAGRVGR